MNKKDKSAIRKFLKQFDITVHFVKTRTSMAYPSISHIDISTVEYPTKSRLWSTVFHELSHIMCFREGLYRKYHEDHKDKRKYAVYVRRYGLRAERFVDRKGKKLMKEYFPDMEYEDSYLTDYEIKWYYKWIEKNYPL